MNRRSIRLLPLVIAGLFMLYQCTSSDKFTNPETGRKSRVGLSTQQEAILGLQTYKQVLSESDTISSGPEFEMVKKVAQRLIAVASPVAKEFDWQVSLVRNPQVNAFCLPGGKIVVYTGILPVTKNEAGLATVMGHEMAHATSRHGAQRIFQQNLTQTALMGIQGSFYDMDYSQQRTLMALIGAGAQYGVLMPFGRDHESEADAVGLMYMARAGYDPHESISFWERMEEASDRNNPPELLSTHPSHGTRIQRLRENLPKAMEEYKRSQPSEKLRIE